MTNLGQRLRAERKKAALSQSEFAKALGIHLNTQSRYEKGEREPDANYLNSLREFGIDVTYVLTGERRDEKGIGVDSDTLTMFGEAVAKLTRTRRSDLQQLLQRATTLQDQKGERGLPPEAAFTEFEETFLLLVAEFFSQKHISLEPDGVDQGAPSGQADLDSELLCRVLEAIKATEEACGLKQLKPEKFAHAATLIYRSAISTGEINLSLVEDLVKLGS